jgi:Slime mold cyclic AMP receptor
MSARWIALREVHAGRFCAAQGALKNAGNVSTSLWTLVIAIHTFTLVFLKVRVPQKVLYATLVLVWLFVGFLVILGPAALQRPEKGPFWGVSGSWCWITTNYVAEQFAMEYLFVSAKSNSSCADVYKCC